MQTPPPEQLNDSGHHERFDAGHPGAGWQRHHRQGDKVVVTPSELRRFSPVTVVKERRKKILLAARSIGIIANKSKQEFLIFNNREMRILSRCSSLSAEWQSWRRSPRLQGSSMHACGRRTFSWCTGPMPLRSSWRSRSSKLTSNCSRKPGVTRRPSASWREREGWRSKTCRRGEETARGENGWLHKISKHRFLLYLIYCL